MFLYTAIVDKVKYGVAVKYVHTSEVSPVLGASCFLFFVLRFVSCVACVVAQSLYSSTGSVVDGFPPREGCFVLC